MRKRKFSLIQDVLDLLLPRYCGACDRRLNVWEEEICNLCLMEIPLSNFHLDLENPVAQVFWGRVRLVQASTWFIYISGSRFGHLLHKLKYESRPGIGVAIGKLYGYQLLRSGSWEIPDYIIPVPLHPKRLKKRGYNQSEMIAKGLSEALSIPMKTDLLVRNTHTKTQTAKTREDRYKNVSGKFEVQANKEQVIREQHILLVDDVITTGATLEACAEVLLMIEGARVSVVGAGFASKI